MKNFKKFYIEITNVCNLNCSFCPPTKRTKAYMTIDDFSDILDKIKGHTQYLYFHVKGEPLLHPELGAFLEVSFQKGFKVNLTTNGTRLSFVKEMLLSKPAIRQINISLQSFNHQEEGDQENYIDQVLEFVLEAHEKTTLFIELRLWNLEEGVTQDSTVNNNQAILNQIQKVFKLPYEIKEEICKGKGIKIVDRIYLSQSNEFEWPDLEKSIIGTQGFCYGLRNQIAVLVDGTVIPCCLDSEGVMNLGNIFETETFNDIITSQRAKRIVDGFSNREVIESMCQRCGYRTRFIAEPHITQPVLETDRMPSGQ